MKPRFYFIIFIIWFLIIIVLSVIPDNSPDKIQVQGFEMRLDYLMHFGVYFLLGFFLKKSTISIPYYFFILLLLFVAALPESMQLLISYRTFNPIDLLFNLLGAILGYLFAFVVRGRYF
jgi:VanZ family protein